MRKDDEIQRLRRERAYFSALVEEATKELARLDMLNLTLTQQKRQAIAAFNFIRIIHEKVEEAFTVDDLYFNVVKALTSELFMDSSALLKINFKTRDISILASSGLPENLGCLKVDENILQEILRPAFTNNKSRPRSFHRFVIRYLKFPYFLWYPIVDKKDSVLVLFAGNRFEDLMSRQPFSETSLETFGAISSVILLRRDNIARTQEILSRKRERIDFLAEILKTSPVSVIATDMDARITYCNPATEKLYGYKAEELIGKDPGMLNAESNAGKIQEEIADTVRQGKVWRGELLNKKKNGDLFYVHVSIYPVVDKEGNFIAFVGFQEDITERKQADEALQESEKKYRGLVNNALVGIYKTNLKDDILYANEALLRMLEFESPEEMMAEGVLTRYKNPKDREVLIENLKKRNRVESFEVELRTKTGKTKDVLLSAALDGDIISGMVMDITKRKLAEKALQEAQRSFEAVVETAPSLIVLTDPDGHIVLFNRACEELTGFKREEVLGKTILELFIPPEWVPIVQKRFADPYAPEVLVPHENPWLTKSGEERLIEWRCKVLPSPEDSRPYILGTGIDTTERKQAQERLQSLLRRLVEIQETDHRCIASELHDQIGQNLTALSINLSVMCSQFSEAVDKRIVDRLKDSLKLVEETIESIRDVMAGLRPPVLDDYGLVVAMRWYSGRFSERTEVSTMLQVEESIPRLPLAVEAALFRIFQEVLTNVAKHAQARQVNVALKEVDGMVQLEITDDGVGFDPLDIQQLRERPKWGLITIEERVKALGGHLYVESVPGKGTRVIVEVSR